VIKQPAHRPLIHTLLAYWRSLLDNLRDSDERLEMSIEAATEAKAFEACP
jgi:hypothetical protein